MGTVDSVAAVPRTVGLLVDGVHGTDSSRSLRCDGLRARARVCGRVVFAVVGVVETGSGGGCDAIALVLLVICGQEDNADLLLLDGRLVGALDAGPDLGDVEALGGIGGDCDGLDEELVFAADVERRVFFHSLQKDLDLDGA